MPILFGIPLIMSIPVIIGMQPVMSIPGMQRVTSIPGMIPPQHPTGMIPPQHPTKQHPLPVLIAPISVRTLTTHVRKQGQVWRTNLLTTSTLSKLLRAVQVVGVGRELMQVRLALLVMIVGLSQPHMILRNCHGLPQGRVA